VAGHAGADQPFAGSCEPNIVPMLAALNPLGLEMSRRLLAALDVRPQEVEG
jgi:hypothetical protein